MPKNFQFDLYAMTSPKSHADLVALLKEAVNELELVQNAFNALQPCKEKAAA